SHLSSFVLPLQLIPPLFPYTTLFRSCQPQSLPIVGNSCGCRRARVRASKSAASPSSRASLQARPKNDIPSGNPFTFAAGKVTLRSEEHTSELQSRENLVCRLLLEKKN